MADIGFMSKAQSTKRIGRTGRAVAAGLAKDGVKILVPAARPKNFTFSQIRETVEKVKRIEAAQRDAASGRYGLRSSSGR